MTTYKTGNPLGSSAAKDLFDNAENLDFAANSLTQAIWIDRLGKPRKSWFGMESAFLAQLASQEARFDAFIERSGYQVIGDYADGPLTITEYNQLIRYNNELWKLTADTDIPFTTAGNTDETWSDTDAAHFVSVGDAALRQNLGSGEGGLGVDLVFGAMRQISITDYMDLASVMRLDNRELVNADIALAGAHADGYRHIRFPRGHYELSSTELLSDVLLEGINDSEFGDIQLEKTDGSSGALSLNTEGSVLHITGQAAANGITISSTVPFGGVVGIVGFSVYYPEQDWANWTTPAGVDIDGDTYYSPTEFPAAFIVEGAMRVKFDKLFFINAYQWIDVKSVQLLSIGDIAGSLINRGIQITRMGAGGYIDVINSYPFWTWACNFAGDSVKINHYCDFKGIVLETTKDDGVTNTIEQVIINKINVIGCADALICGGKGTIVNSGKFDNCMRGVTVTSRDNSAYHQFNNIWASIYYRNNYANKQRKDGDVYAFSSDSATPVNINNWQVVRTDGYGLNMPYSSGSNVSNIIVQNCMYKAYVFGSRSRQTDVINVDNCYAGMYSDASLDQTSYEIGDFMRCKIRGLQYKGGANVKPYVLNNAFNFYEVGKELDLTTLGGTLYKGLSNTEFSQERGLRGQIVSLSSSSTATLRSLNLRGSNTGGVTTNVGYGIRNTTGDGNGHGAFVLYASSFGAATEIAEAFSDGSNLGLRPRGTDKTLGDTLNPWKNIFSASALTVTSDRRKKQDFSDIDPRLVSAVSKLKPQQYRLRDGDGKWIIGYIAQDVVATFEREGLNAFDYSVVVCGEDGYLALQYEQLAILKSMVQEWKLS